MPQQQPLSFGQVHSSLVGLFDGDMHAKRIESLANATLGVVKTGSLAVSTIGQGLALARGLTTKHAIKQVDRLLSNEGIDIDAALRHWVPYVVGPRTSINVAIDWTEFDADGQATLMLSLLTRHGRATPLLWLTVDTSTLKNRRNEYEYPSVPLLLSTGRQRAPLVGCWTNRPAEQRCAARRAGDHALRVAGRLIDIGG